jgi:hypothetical protein
MEKSEIREIKKQRERGERIEREMPGYVNFFHFHNTYSHKN